MTTYRLRSYTVDNLCVIAHGFEKAQHFFTGDRQRDRAAAFRGLHTCDEPSENITHPTGSCGRYCYIKNTRINKKKIDLTNMRIN